MKGIEIELARQTLRLWDDRVLLREYLVSTATKGPGEKNGSGCTPRGRHKVRAMIGRGAPAGTVFASRRPTGEIYSPKLAARYPYRDWILTRILWLSGVEVGKNRLGDVDTMRRYIYIHGTPDGTQLGVPSSQGCVRMSNHEIIELFDRIEPGIEVVIR